MNNHGHWGGGSTEPLFQFNDIHEAHNVLVCCGLGLVCGPCTIYSVNVVVRPFYFAHGCAARGRVIALGLDIRECASTSYVGMPQIHHRHNTLHQKPYLSCERANIFTPNFVQAYFMAFATDCI